MVLHVIVGVAQHLRATKGENVAKNGWKLVQGLMQFSERKNSDTFRVGHWYEKYNPREMFAFSFIKH